MVSVAQALERVKHDVAGLLSPESIRQICREVSHQWRERQFGPVTTIHLFVHQILHHNTACSHLGHIVGEPITAPASCRARQRLPLDVFEILVKRVAWLLERTTSPVEGFRGHRTWIVDGSGFSMPDTPALQKQFGQPGGQKAGCGFPVAHLLALFNADTGMIRETIVAPLRTHDLSQVDKLHPLLRPGDLLLADRGFCSYAHLALILKGGLHAVFRVHQRHIVDFKPGRPQRHNLSKPE